ncbi:MAG: hypothetical protein K2Q15_15720, partial [Burkholderiales bacterium]|nr:hypothetical protein [Burkholderiales bacterium]
MPYLAFITVVWALSFNLIGVFLAGHVDSDFAVLSRVAIATLVFLPFTRFNRSGVARMGNEEIIKRDDKWSARVGGMITTPPLYNFSLSGGV